MVGSHIDITAWKDAEERLRHNEIQLLTAQEIQRALLPTDAPSVDWLDIAAISHPAVFAGGDYFDYLPMLGGALGMVVGDVSGHGFGPALLMASTQAFLRCLAQTCATLGEIVFRLNNFTVMETGSERFVTQLLVRFDPKTRSLTYVNAGHPTGYVLDRWGCLKAELTTGGLPLGILEDQEYPTLEPLSLEPGDVLVLVTDGVLEANCPNGELFGRQRALDAVQRTCEEPARGIVEHLISAVSDFCGGKEANDDVTALVAKVTLGTSSADGEFGTKR
jgi:sigma-B regulation protein RsbU (phosphoserine phosphatase)